MTTEVLGHKLILKTAIEMAEVSFEQLMAHNAAYAEFKQRRAMTELPDREVRRRYLAVMAPFFIQSARATLAQMLSLDISEELKETISDALIKDHAFQATRTF